MSQSQAKYMDLASDRDAQVRLLTVAVDGIKDAHGALEDFMRASACWHWSRDFLDEVCNAQNAIIGLMNSVGWDQITEESNSIPEQPEVEE